MKGNAHSTVTPYARNDGQEEFGLNDDDIKRIQAVFSGSPGVERVIIYGSRAKGNFKPGSDIDLTVDGLLEWDKFLQLEVALDDLMLPYIIDLSLKSHIDNESLKEHIKRKGKIFYQRG